MTRNEEITHAARMLAATKRTTESYNQCMYDFELGAEWADNHPHWISVKDRLPESNEKEEFGMIGYPTVLVALEDGYVDTSYYDTTQECWGDYDGEVEYWMPLPKVPKKEDGK